MGDAPERAIRSGKGNRDRQKQASSDLRHLQGAQGQGPGIRVQWAMAPNKLGFQEM